MDSTISRLPKIAPTVLRRAELAAWLEFHADVPLRYLSAPAGSGKTTVAVMYARTRPNAVGYVRLHPDFGLADVYARIAAAAGCEAVSDYEALLASLSTVARLEIIVDDIDAASPSVRAALSGLYDDVAEHVSLVYLARSPEAIATGSGERQGLVAMCDPGRFAFRTDEIAAYARLLGLSEDPLSIARLQRETQGWATAVAGVCREAAANGSTVHEFWPQWRHRSHERVAQIVGDALDAVPAAVAAQFRHVVSGGPASATGGPAHATRALKTFARYGLFVHEHDGRYILNPLVAAVVADEQRSGARADAAVDTAIVKMFGRFEFTINGKPVVWQRRRDRELIAFLAASPNGRATRAQLIATFWPHADRHLGAQSLRTTCSTIRRALGACVGPTNVERFFAAADGFVELKGDAVENSVARFVAHVAAADAAYDRRESRTAYLEYAAAERLYRAPFLAGEPRADWSDQHAERLAAVHVHVMTRLDRLTRAFTSDDVRNSGLFAVQTRIA